VGRGQVKEDAVSSGLAGFKGLRGSEVMLFACALKLKNGMRVSK
jgi:hypothetical protein